MRSLNRLRGNGNDENKAKKWRRIYTVGNGSYLENNVVYLYDGHNREGWEDMGRNLSRKKVDLRKASAQYIQKSIFIKNGRKCDPPIKEKIFMSRDEFVKTYIGYYGQNM